MPKSKKMASKKEGSSFADSLMEKFGMFDYVKEGIAVIDKTGKIMFINKAIVDKWGYSKDEFIGKRFQALNIVSPKSMTNIISTLAGRLLGDEAEKDYDVVVKTKSGQERIAEVSSMPLKEGNKIFGIVATLADRTEERKIDEEIRKRNKELEKFYKIAVGRELRIEELKKKVKELEEKLNSKK